MKCGFHCTDLDESHKCATGWCGGIPYPISPRSVKQMERVCINSFTPLCATFPETTCMKLKLYPYHFVKNPSPNFIKIWKRFKIADTSVRDGRTDVVHTHTQGVCTAKQLLTSHTLNGETLRSPIHTCRQSAAQIGDYGRQLRYDIGKTKLLVRYEVLRVVTIKTFASLTWHRGVYR